MVSVGQHKNIELLSYSEVEEVSGYVGNFNVKVRKKARYVDEELCTGCGLCQEKCTTKKIPSEFDEGLGMRTAIYVPFPQAVPKVPVIDKDNCRYFKTGKCKVCSRFCPTKAVDYEQEDQILEYTVGAIIMATGFSSFDPTPAKEYGYGRYPEVYTGMEFERVCNAGGPTRGKIVTKDGREPESIAILHCIGSRDENYNVYCSRVCCMYALKLAHLVKDNTNAEVYNLYIDIRAFGKGYEEFYRRLLKEDVIFIRGRGTEITDIAETAEENGKLIVTCEDTLLGEIRRLPVDMVVLATGMEPSEDAVEVSRTFSISRSADGFFREAHPKLRPVDTTSDGLFLAGACQGPKDIPDSVAQGAAAAARALTLIDAEWVDLEPVIAQIIKERCSACGECVEACPYKAITVDETAEVNEALCKGCGTCVGHCLSKAIRLLHYTDEQLVAEMKGVLNAALAEAA